MQDQSDRHDFALRFMAKLHLEAYWPTHILWTDEISFHSEGTVSTQKSRIYGSLHAVQQKPLHCSYLIV